MKSRLTASNQESTPLATSPSTEADTVAKLRDYFDQMTQAQCEFEELWFASGEGERLPPVHELRRLLRRIAGRANLLELSFLWLRMQREMPEPGQSPTPTSAPSPAPTP